MGNRKPGSTFTKILVWSAVAVLAAVSATRATDDHALLCEAPTDGAEFIEIHSPTLDSIPLRNYYLSDDDYAKLPGQFEGWPVPDIGTADFISRFPDDASLPPLGTLVVALKGSEFRDEFGFSAHYEIKDTDATPDMEATYAGSIGTHYHWGFKKDGEHVVLFRWDGSSDLVEGSGHCVV